MTPRGFTLIETIVYLALFGLLMSGVIVTTYNLFESAARTQTEAMLSDEGNFIIGKIQWALSGTQSINSPGIGAYGSQLSVNKVTGVDNAGNPIVTAVTIGTSGSDVTIQEGAVPALVLNNTNVNVTRLGFYHVIDTGGGTDPERVEASTTITARGMNGMLISRDFSTVGYLRR